MTFKDIKASWPYSERLEKRISCEKCGALFDTKKARREHIIAAHPFAATHFSCSLCQKSFRGLKGLKSHQQNVDCQKSKRQARSQSEKTSDFKCDKCPVMCTSKKSLKVNISSVVEYQRWWVLKSTSSSKIGHVLENKVVQKLKLDFFLYKNGLLN